MMVCRSPSGGTRVDQHRAPRRERDRKGQR
nr:MAG TPA: hypothetical protein [Caudoviricetes sp.]